MDAKNKILIAILVLLVVLFAFILFKNIAYPLFWNDEGETAMFATRIMEYGYPKVHGVNNILYQLPLPMGEGVEKETDAFIGGTGWGHFYFAVIGSYLADKVDDVYLKTALIRGSFALMGLVGLAILAVAVSLIWEGRPDRKLLFFIGFAVFEVFSVFLLLHLRQARYYPLVIFLTSCIFWTYIRYRFFNKIKYLSYIIAATLFLMGLFITFSPLYFIFIAAIFLFELWEIVKKKKAVDFISGISPLLCSFVLLMPVFLYFKTFQIAGVFTRYHGLDAFFRFEHFWQTVSFLQQYEYLNPFIVVKIILGVLCFYLWRNKILHEKSSKRGLRISGFLSLFILVYILAITKVPYKHIYERYFIGLQPVLIVVLILDIFTVFDLISGINILRLKKRLTTVISVLMILSFVPGTFNRAGRMKEYFYEITHRYQGPLDFIVPFVKHNFPGSEDLVIATNYESQALMYYLKSKVIVGFSRSNIREDMKMRPDIIVPRRAWHNYPVDLFNKFLQKGKYVKKSFPVADYPTNNIPSLEWWPFPHLYKTKAAEDENTRLSIYLLREEGDGSSSRERDAKVFGEGDEVSSKTDIRKKSPGDVERLNELGIEQGKAGNIDNAISMFEQAIAIDPDHAESYNNIGYAYFMKGDLISAKKYFAKTIEIDPEHEKARQNLEAINQILVTSNEK